MGDNDSDGSSDPRNECSEIETDEERSRRDHEKHREISFRRATGRSSVPCYPHGPLLSAWCNPLDSPQRF